MPRIFPGHFFPKITATYTQMFRTPIRLLEGIMDWIFYLQDTSKLTDHYLKIADRLKDYGITLIPIKSSDLINLSKDKRRIHVVSVVTNREEKMAFNSRAKRICSLMLKQNKMFLYQLTSFDDLISMSDFNHIQRNLVKCKFPIKVGEFSSIIAENFFTDEYNDNKWPGGKRPKRHLEGL
jgi:hypothetical protein